jgi:hypothetical protein
VRRTPPAPSDSRQYTPGFLCPRSEIRTALAVAIALLRHSQPNAIVLRMNEILLRAEVSLGGLNRRMAEQQLDLLKLATCATAHLRATAPQVMWGDSGYARRRRIWLQVLPDDLFGHAFALHLVRAVHRSQRAWPSSGEVASD